MAIDVEDGLDDIGRVAKPFVRSFGVANENLDLAGHRLGRASVSGTRKAMWLAPTTPMIPIVTDATPTDAIATITSEDQRAADRAEVGDHRPHS